MHKPYKTCISCREIKIKKTCFVCNKLLKDKDYDCDEMLQEYFDKSCSSCRNKNKCSFCYVDIDNNLNFCNLCVLNTYNNDFDLSEFIQH